MASILALVLLVAAAPTKSAKQIEHKGPAGVAWGSSAEDVKTALSSKYALEKEGAAGEGDVVAAFQRYSGEFGGFAADDIEAGFDEQGRLISFAVILQQEDVRPASKRWEEVVQKMTEAYGPPEQKSKPPTSAAARLSGSLPDTPSARRLRAVLESQRQTEEETKYQRFDYLIQTGAYEPMARWKFKNNVLCVAGVKVGEPDDETGLRSLQVIWMYVTKAAAERMKKTQEQQRDF